jgi:tetratricopeptide (TPR) repeat protein
MERLHLLHPIGEFVRAEWKHNAYEEAAEIQLDVAKRLMIQVLYLHFKYLHSEETAWGLARIDVDLPNYIHAMRYGLWGSKTRNAEGKDPTPYLEIIAGLSTGLSSYFFIRGMLKYKLSFAKFGAEAEEKLGKYESAADTYFGLATMQTRFHDYDGLQETTTKLVALSEKTSNLRIQALTSMALGEQARQDHDLALLISHYEQAVNYFRNALLQDRSKYNIGMLGNALSRLGRGYELTRKHQKALNIHLEALDYHKEINDNVNLGNVYHHLGNCYATLGDFAEAIQSYKQAIEFFVELGHAQYLSNALCEIGEVVVEAGLNSDLTQFLSYDLLVWGLEDLKREVELLLEKRYTAIYLQGWNGQLLRKIFAVIKLVSLSTETHILRNWAEQFGEETFLPLMESPDEEIALYLEQQRSFINYLRLILTIALVIGEIAESEESPTNEQLNELCNYCYQFGELGWGFFKPFEWLATWLHENGICPNVPTHKLHIAVEQSMWTGEPIKF